MDEKYVYVGGEEEKLPAAFDFLHALTLFANDYLDQADFFVVNSNNGPVYAYVSREPLPGWPEDLESKEEVEIEIPKDEIDLPEQNAPRPWQLTVGKLMEVLKDAHPQAVVVFREPYRKREAGETGFHTIMTNLRVERSQGPLVVLTVPDPQEIEVIEAKIREGRERDNPS